MSISCLVISRSAGLLNKMLTSLVVARRYWDPEDEVLLAWNGSEAGEQAITPASDGPTFRIAIREAYHFASNMNHLASQARGEVLILLNDDLILDPGSLDHALQILESQSGVGLVGGRLRQQDGRLGHAGILFSEGLLPYNRFRPERLGSLLAPDRLEILASGEMPAVTGALMVIRRYDFLAVKFREDFRVCGEDVALCLDLRQQLALATYYAADVTAVHAEKSTRSEVLDLFDQQKLAGLVRDLCREDPSLRGSMAHWASQEADVLESLLHQVLQSQNRFSIEARLARTELKQLEEHWQEQQSHALDWHDRLDLLDEQLKRLTRSNPNQLQAEGPDLAELISEIERLRLEGDQLRLEGDQLRIERDRFSTEHSRFVADKERLRSERDNLIADKERLRSERDNLASDKERLRAERDSLVAKPQSSRGERDSLFAERNKLVGERDRLSAQLERLVEDKDSLSAERSKLLDEQDSLCAERDNLVAEQEILVAERDNLVAEREFLLAEREELIAQQESLAKERNSLNMALDRALAELELTRIREADLRSSTCWKLTAPYRVVGDWLARSRSRS